MFRRCSLPRFQARVYSSTDAGHFSRQRSPKRLYNALIRCNSFTSSICNLISIQSFFVHLMLLGIYQNIGDERIFLKNVKIYINLTHLLSHILTRCDRHISRQNNICEIESKNFLNTILFKLNSI